MTNDDSVIIDQMVDYMQNFLEKPHPVFGEMPICPFAQAARLKQRIFYKVYRFSVQDLDKRSELMMGIQDFNQSDQYEALWVIHPDRLAMSLETLQQFVGALNQTIETSGLVAFGGHPHDPFNIQGVYTRQEPYINVIVQTYKTVRTASNTLLKTYYYTNWSLENLRQIGLPRNNEH